MPWQQIAKTIGDATGKAFTVERRRSVYGGDINKAYRIEGEGQRYFVKINCADRLSMFEAEAEGLNELAAADAVRVPHPVCCGTVADSAFLVLEWVELRNRSDPQTAGRQLAVLHRKIGSTFGWHRDNTLGSTPQVNTPNSDWLAFWREHRLGFQLRLAAQNGHTGALQEKGERLMEALPALFGGYRPAASLLHGDLWCGNWAADAGGSPVIFDPAVYYGDREADLAMTELFGGFEDDFYAAYRGAWPLDPGYAQRKTLYNLYHILNHLNLFGGGYAGQAQRMLDALLRIVASK